MLIDQIRCPICAGPARLYGRAPMNEAMTVLQPRLKLFLDAYEAAGIDEQGVYLCDACGHGCVSPVPGDEAVVSAEGGEITGWSDPERRPRRPDVWRDKLRLPAFQRLVDRYAPAPRRVLDVGARGGSISCGLRLPDAAAIDLMQADTDYALSEDQRPIRRFAGLLANLEPAYRADLILALHVIEHVDEPVAFLSDIGERLSDEGVAVIEAPYEHADAWSVAAGRICSLNHKQYFTPWSLRRAVTEAGLELLELEVDGHFHTGYPAPAPAPCPVARVVVRRGAPTPPWATDALAATLNAWHGSFAGTVALNEDFDVFFYGESCLTMAAYFAALPGCRNLFSTNDALHGREVGGHVIRAVEPREGTPFLICLEWFSRDAICNDLSRHWRVI
jgi:SAM-dependent methyltransferase